MLGVRRPTVSDIAHKLKEEGLVDYKRGNFVVADRHGLEGRSCECYELMEREMDRIFDVPWREGAKGNEPQGGKR